MFGSSEVAEIQDELVGSAIMIFNLQIGNYENSRSQVARETPEAVDCFLEATGVAAGIALVGALTGELGGKALKQAFKKAVKKIWFKIFRRSWVVSYGYRIHLVYD